MLVLLIVQRLPTQGILFCEYQRINPLTQTRLQQR